MSKPNKDGWIRHRGGKCPVEDGELVDVRYRDGTYGYRLEAGRDYSFATDHHSGWDANFEYWNHDDMSGDIMAWRPHKPAYTDFQKAPMIEAPKKPEAIVLDYSPSLHIQSLGRVYRHEGDPRKMRDRIREIDAASKEEEARHCAAMEAYDAERASLVAKLKAEGFVLIQSDEPNSELESAQDDIAQQDMSDPANWMVGDLIAVIDPEDSGLRAGDMAKIIEMDSGSDDDMPCKLEGAKTWLWLEHMKWHSRPTN